MTYLKNPPAQQDLMNEFDWAKTRQSERAKRRQQRRTYYWISDGLKYLKGWVRGRTRKEIRIIDRCAPPGGNFLDVGCADGGTLRQLDVSRWRPFGIEPSPSLAQRADAYCRPHGGAVRQAVAVDGLGAWPPGHFQCVMMRSFLEHEIHVADVLRLARQTLAPGGVVIIKVPNFGCWNSRLRGAGWPGVRLPDHVNYFRPGDLRRALEAAGFTTVRFPWWRRSPTSDNMWAVAGG
jgi:SAM-dependent methyltransferase